MKKGGRDLYVGEGKEYKCEGKERAKERKGRNVDKVSVSVRIRLCVRVWFGGRGRGGVLYSGYGKGISIVHE